MPRKAVEVDWAVATDERMRQVVQKGTATAHPELGHAVHVEVGGLEAGHKYFYQSLAYHDQHLKALVPRRSKQGGELPLGFLT